MSEPKRILIVDDHPVVRRGLSQLFEREAGLCVCGTAATAAEALLSVSERPPDLVVADLILEGPSGLELVKQFARLHPDLPVLILSMHDERLYAARALAAGARGYVMKSAPDLEVVRAVHTVLDGRVYVGEAVRATVGTTVGTSVPAGDGALFDLLTDRELEVFLLLGEGYAPRHIAERLNLSVSTVEVYRERLKEKLHVDSSALLIRYAVAWCRDRVREPLRPPAQAATR